MRKPTREAKQNDGKESMLGHTYIWLQVNVGVLARIRTMDSTNPYFILSEVERRGQAKRLNHRGLNNRR